MQKPSRYAWLVVALLAPVAMLNYLDRQMLAAMKFSVMADIPDVGSEANWGKILALFKWTYALLSPIGGLLADRYSRRHLIAFSLGAWSAITWATGQVATYDQLMVTRAVMGVAEALYIPAALALIAAYHPGSTRSRAIGIHQMGIYAGIIVGGFSGYVADHPEMGWRWMFDACGVVGVLYAVPLFLLVRNAATAAETSAARTPVRRALGELFGNGSFGLLVAYFTLPAMAGWIVRDWMPAILKTEFAIGQGKAGVSATIYWMTAAIVSAIAGGWLADRWMRRTPKGRIYVSAIGTGMIGIALLWVGYSPQTGMLSVAIAGLVVFGLGWGLFDVNNMPILCQIAGPRLRATGYGLMNMVSISFGGVADWGFGAARDARAPLALIFGAAAAIAAVSVWLVLRIRPRIDDEAPAR